MKKNLLHIALFSFICFPYSLMSQEGKTTRAMVFTKSGIGMSGYLSEIRVGRDDDTLILNSAKKTEKILVGDLARVIVLPRNQQGTFFLAGALAGTYIATLLIGQSDQQPTGFLTEDFTTGAAALLTAVLGFGVGGGVGGLFKSGSNDDLVLDFNQNNREKKSARLSLYEIFSPESMFRKIHFSVQGGHVNARVSKEFQKFAGRENYSFVDRGSEFNLLRKIQLTYSFKPDLEIGGAVQWSSEPRVSEYIYTYNQNSGSSSSTSYEQSFKIIGYYGVGKYKPFYTEFPRQIDISVGGGIGIANIEFKRGINTSPYYYYQQFTSFQNDVTETAVSAIVFGECSYYLREYLTLGITADFVYFNPKTVPSDPTVNLPEQTISGNTCIGFVLGIHL